MSAKSSNSKASVASATTTVASSSSSTMMEGIDVASIGPSNPATNKLHPHPDGTKRVVPLEPAPPSKSDKDEKLPVPGGGAKPAAAAKPVADKPADPKKDVKGLDDDKDGGKPLKLSSKDKKEFVVERKHAFVSTLVKTSLENDDKAEEVPIPGVTGAILELVVNYMKEHKGVEPPIIEKPLRSKVMKDVCPHKWDADYIDKIGDTRQQLYDLILAANYMDIKSLLHLGCAKVASLIKGQPLEKIKEILDPNQGAKKADSKDTAAAPTNGVAAAVGTRDLKEDQKKPNDPKLNDPKPNDASKTKPTTSSSSSSSTTASAAPLTATTSPAAGGGGSASAAKKRTKANPMSDS